MAIQLVRRTSGGGAQGWRPGAHLQLLRGLELILHRLHEFEDVLRCGVPFRHLRAQVEELCLHGGGGCCNALALALLSKG